MAPISSLCHAYNLITFLSWKTAFYVPIEIVLALGVSYSSIFYSEKNIFYFYNWITYTYFTIICDELIVYSTKRNLSTRTVVNYELSFSKSQTRAHSLNLIWSHMSCSFWCFSLLASIKKKSNVPRGVDGNGDEVIVPCRYTPLLVNVNPILDDILGLLLKFFHVA